MASFWCGHDKGRGGKKPALGIENTLAFLAEPRTFKTSLKSDGGQEQRQGKTSSKNYPNHKEKKKKKKKKHTNHIKA